MSDEEDSGVPMCGLPRTPVKVPPMENKIESRPVEKQKPLPCIVCGYQPDPAFSHLEEGTAQPYGATMFSAGSGHYGSTVWDEMSASRSLEINVCDRCLVKRFERTAVVTTRSRQDVKYDPWDISPEMVELVLKNLDNP